MENKEKVVIVDYSIFLHRAIFSWRKRKDIPPEYTCLSMIVGCLSKVGVEPCDRIILAIDARNSWRKDVDKAYKGNRKEYREKQTDIDWDDMYARFNILLEDLDKGTDWNILKLDRLEADDIIAVGCRYYKNKEVVIVSYDKDFEQLIIYPNVKIFSPLTKKYKIVENPYTTLAKKIEKETSDNLTSPILSAEDYEKRKMIVSLIELPDFVEQSVKIELNKLGDKSGDLRYVPFETIRNRIGRLYNDKKNVVSYEKCLKPKRKKKIKKRKKNV